MREDAALAVLLMMAAGGGGNEVGAPAPLQEPLAESAPAATDGAILPPSEDFALLDRDGDGYVTLREYLADRREAFNRMDRNHDYKLSRRELPTVESTAKARP